MSKEKMDAYIERLRSFVEDAEDQNLVLGAFVYWTVAMIKGTDNPEETVESICELIKQGVHK